MLKHSLMGVSAKLCACSSVDRVPGYEPVGRRFESCMARHLFPLNRYIQGYSSVGRVPVSKTVGRGFESSCPCQEKSHSRKRMAFFSEICPSGK